MVVSIQVTLILPTKFLQAQVVKLVKMVNISYKNNTPKNAYT